MDGLSLFAIVSVPFFRNIAIFSQSILRFGGLNFDYFPCAEMLSVQQNVECYFGKAINVSLPPFFVGLCPVWSDELCWHYSHQMVHGGCVIVIETAKWHTCVTIYLTSYVWARVGVCPQVTSCYLRHFTELRCKG